MTSFILTQYNGCDLTLPYARHLAKLEFGLTKDLLTITPHHDQPISPSIVVGYKLRGHFKFFFIIMSDRVTILDVRGPVDWTFDRTTKLLTLF